MISVLMNSSIVKSSKSVDDFTIDEFMNSKSSILDTSSAVFVVWRAERVKYELILDFKFTALPM